MPKTITPPSGTQQRVAVYPPRRKVPPQTTFAQPAQRASDTTTSPGFYVPNTPGAPVLAQGSGSDLTVTWTAPPADSTHNAATGFNLRSSLSGVATWKIVSGVASPYDLSGLEADVAIDVQLQSSNATGTSGWSATSTLATASAGP